MTTTLHSSFYILSKNPEILWTHLRSPVSRLHPCCSSLKRSRNNGSIGGVPEDSEEHVPKMSRRSSASGRSSGSCNCHHPGDFVGCGSLGKWMRGIFFLKRQKYGVKHMYLFNDSCSFKKKVGKKSTSILKVVLKCPCPAAEIWTQAIYFCHLLCHY